MTTKYESNRRVNTERLSLNKSVLISTLSMITFLILHTTYVVNWAATFKAEFKAEQVATIRAFKEITEELILIRQTTYTKTEAEKDFALRDFQLRQTAQILKEISEKFDVRIRDCERKK